MTKELESKMCNFFLILNSFENWVNEIWKILIQLDSSHQYNCYEVQHAFVWIKIKEVMSNSIFSEFYYMFSFQFSMTPVQIINLISTCLLVHYIPI